MWEGTLAPILQVNHCPLWTDRPVAGSQGKPALNSNLLWEYDKHRFCKKNHFPENYTTMICPILVMGN